MRSEQIGYSQYLRIAEITIRLGAILKEPVITNKVVPLVVHRWHIATFQNLWTYSFYDDENILMADKND